MLFILFFSYDFNPLSPCRERRVFFVIIAPSGPFQSTLPMRGETTGLRIWLPVQRISIHSPHAGRDTPQSTHAQKRSDFNPLSPCGERLFRSSLISTLSSISIHSPHAGRDRTAGAAVDTAQISIHSPHAGRDDVCGACYSRICDFNPLSPCGERHAERAEAAQSASISIHSPHAGRDDTEFVVFDDVIFQSTLPMRGETCQSCKQLIDQVISIHSPHAGRDQSLRYQNS